MEAQGHKGITVAHHELGLSRIEMLYRARDYDILIDKSIRIPGKGVLEESGPNWKAVLISVTGDWIHQLYQDHGDKLFHANFRDFIGVTAHRGNINSGIKSTAETDPANFWIYNNGITAITHEIKKATKSEVRIRGISIVNGAQTTGALGEVTSPNLKDAKIILRLVQCEKELVPNVILFNNTQNEIKAFDRRSNDPVQKKLRNDFERYHITYVHRRSAVRNQPGSIYAQNMGPWLCAFHGELQTAARNAKDIFLDQDTYDRVFRSIISAEHVYLAHTLAHAIDQLKTEFKQKVKGKTATEIEIAQDDILKYSLSKLFVLYLVGRSAEEISQTKIPDLLNWKFQPTSISPEGTSATKAWIKALQAILAQIPGIIKNANSTAYDVTRSQQLTDSVVEQIRAVLAGLAETYKPPFADLKKKTSV